MQNIETLPLSDYVTKFGGNAEGLEKMMDVFDKPPASRRIPQNPHCNKTYVENASQQHTINVVAILADKIFATLICKSREPAKDAMWCWEQYGFIPFQDGKPKSGYKAYLYGTAAFFNFVQMGNCSDRCCIAAIKLRRMINDNSIQIKIQSAPSRDHFIILLGSKETGWHIYDPVTNGRILFPMTYYQKNVLPTFKEIPKEKRARQMDFTVTHEVANDFHARWPKIKAAMIKLAKEKLPSENELSLDFNYLIALKENGIVDFAAAVKAAIQGFRVLVGGIEQKNDLLQD